MKNSHPSPLELQVLSVLWARGESTVREVLDQLPDGRPRAYTTVLSVLQTMESKGFVSRKTNQKAHRYRAKKSEKLVTGPLLKDLIRNGFHGDGAALILAVLDHVKLSKEEQDQIISKMKETGSAPAREKKAATRKARSVAEEGS